MVVASIATILGLIVVLVAYYRDPPVRDRLEVRPDWGVLPDPSDVARTSFPVAPMGYDPATVEVHFEALNRAYSDLLAAAPPEVVERARQRASMREGVGTAGPAGPGTAQGPDPAAVREQPPLATPEAADAEALRAEAALAEVDTHTTEG